jgi:hypothetical protein
LEATVPRKTLILMVGLANLIFASVQAWAQDLPRDAPEAYYYGVDYADLTAEEKALWAKLGWNEGAWSADTPEAYPETEWSKWTGLSDLQQDALRSLGYDQKTWDRNRPRSGVEIIEAFWNSLKWDKLSPAEQNLWRVLGWDEKSWSGASAEPSSEEKYWDELSDAERFAAGKLGYDQTIWDSN